MSKKRPNGDGMVRKRADGRWEGRLTIGHKNDGRPIYKTVLSRTQKELIEKMDNLKAQYRGVEIVEGGKMTVSDYTKKWFEEYAKANLRPSTCYSYQLLITNMEKYIGNIALNRLSHFDIQYMYGKIQKQKKETNVGWSNSTIRKLHFMLHEIMESAQKENIICENPLDKVTPPKIETTEMKVLDSVQIEKFIQAIEKEPYWYDFFYLELTTGLRRGEICALKWSDFDESRKELHIRRSLSKDFNNCIIVGDTKTDTSTRTILLPESTYQLLAERKKTIKSEWIFPSLYNDKEFISPNSAYQMLKKILKANDLPSIRFHDLRHTFATQAMQNGVNVKALSGILGHTNTSFTLDTYTHVTNDMKKNATDRMENFMTSLLGDG